MRCLGLIPARGGSRGIPRKNLAPLAGRPLIAYTCAAALASRRLARVLVSTDDEEIAAAARAVGVDAPFLRPRELAGDETPMVDVMRHALDWCDAHDAARYDAVVLLQPTSPLRTARHVDAAVELCEASGANTVVTVVRVPHQFEPGSLMMPDRRGALVPLEEGPLQLRRQDKPTLFARNGPAVLVVRRETLMAGNLYGHDVRGLEMSAGDSVDVDTAEDLELAELWMRERGGTAGNRG